MRALAHSTETDHGDIGTVEAVLTLAADEGMALEELRERWTDAARRTGHPRALEMASHYESLLSANPTRLTAMEALAFRLHDRVSLAPSGNDPVFALLDAGWDALPGLIRFRHDPRPTRTPGSFYVRAWPRDTSLMTIGEACEDLLHEILIVVPDSDLTALWAGGPRAHYSALLASEDETTALSALGRLYSLAPVEYRDAALERMRGATDSARMAFLTAAGHELARREPEFIVSLLPSAADILLHMAGVLLWEERGSPAAAREILRRMAAAPPAKFSDLLWSHLDMIDHEEVRQGIARLLATGSSEIKIAILIRDWPACGGEFDSAARALLDDPTPSLDPDLDKSWRLCDFAARALFQRREKKRLDLGLLTPDRREELVARERALANK